MLVVLRAAGLLVARVAAEVRQPLPAVAPVEVAAVGEQAVGDVEPLLQGGVRQDDAAEAHVA